MVWTHREITYDDPETKPSLNHVMHSFILRIGSSSLWNVCEIGGYYFDDNA